MVVSRRGALDGARRLVVKVGSALLTHPETLAPDGRTLLELVSQLVAQRTAGRQVILVSSGAVSLGLAAMGLTERPADVATMQACAACGQVRLMHHYSEAFGMCGVPVAQVLVTHADLADRTRYLNARRAVSVMLEHGVLPIFNENDTVSVDEIKLGDNDTLGAEVAALMDADGYVILTDQAGLFDRDPRAHPQAERVGLVEQITPQIRAMAGGAQGLGTGGMATKVKAADVAGRSGVWTVIAPGRRAGVLQAVLEGQDVGTLFVAGTDREPARKRWIAHTLRARGSLTVDAGAAKAVRGGRASLLPAGIRGVDGQFDAGDAVDILAADGAVLARGLVMYSAEDIRKIAGRKTGEIQTLLGYKYADEVIHKDDLVLT